MQPIKTASNTKQFQYDVCNCKTCLEEAVRVEYDEDVPKKKKGSQKSVKKRYETGDPSVGLLGEPSGKFDYYVLYGPEQTERVDSDIEDAASRTEAQDQAQGINVFINTDSKQQLTFDDIPPSKWRERRVEMLSWCSAELQCYNIDMDPQSSGKENGVPIEDIPTEVFLDDEVWSEEDPQAEEWSEAINEYYNDRFTKCSFYNRIFEVNTKEIRMFGDIPKDDPLHQNPPEFTIDMLNIPAKFKGN
ncbi:hypothetical protein L1987_08885 [Smallanthus sonchifolius]|uniref:Uncharacterized protein n=1 Tax=Smallanthus sonchifolius TaxID=185202 RepID=A0ACB9JNJ2_9ASTR|nr:hypothetical protein L1987_08885 [Smallanthus sonchifolius]